MVDELHCRLPDDAMIFISFPLFLSSNFLSNFLSLSLSLSSALSFSPTVALFNYFPLSHFLCVSLQREFMFPDHQIDISGPPEGMMWPVNSIQDVQQTVCAILDYLGNHMPQIIGTFIKVNKTPHNMVARISAFKTNFKSAAALASLHTSPPHCVQRNVPLYDFEKKVHGLRILHFSRQWVEEFINSTCVFQPSEWWLKPLGLVYFMFFLISFQQNSYLCMHTTAVVQWWALWPRSEKMCIFFQYWTIQIPQIIIKNFVSIHCCDHLFLLGDYERTVGTVVSLKQGLISCCGDVLCEVWWCGLLQLHYITSLHAFECGQNQIRYAFTLSMHNI